MSVGKLQNVDFETAAQITGAGGTIDQLLNTSKVYDSTNLQLLDTTIAAKFDTASFTDAAVTGKVLTGFVSGAGVVSAADSILTAINKLDGNIAAITGTVSTVSVVNANGFDGTVANPGTTPAITIKTTISGLLKGNGTAISAAVASTDYLAATVGAAIQKADGAGGLTAATSGTDYQAPISTSAAVANQFVTGFTAPNTFTRAQPDFTNLSGNATNGQMPTYTNHGVILGTGAAGFSNVAVGATNTVLHGNTGADPTFSAIVGADMTNNTVGNAQLRQGVAQSVIGVTGNATANVADIAASAADQILRANNAGTAIAFGAIDLSKAGAVGASILSSANVGLLRTLNAQVGTTYTPVLSDGSGAGGNTLVTLTNASAITVTIPTNASVAFPIGTQIDFSQDGAGKVTFSPAGGVTINSKGANLSIGGQYVGVSLVKTATNVWTLYGDLIP